MMEQMSIFDFAINENGEFINLKEQQEKRDAEYFKEYSFEELIKDHEQDDDFIICATFCNSLSQWGNTFEEIQKEIQEQADSKTYHFGNLDKGIYAYSYKIKFEDGEVMYWFVIENKNHIVVIRHFGKIEELLDGTEKICYPACACYLFEHTENGLKQITSGYGNGKDDIRYKILCDEFKILEFSGNRIYPNKKPTDFYEAEYEFGKFVEYWKQSKLKVEVDE